MELFDLGDYAKSPGMKERTKTVGKHAAAIREAAEALPEKDPDHYHVVTKPSQLEEISQGISQAGGFVFDVETSDTNPWNLKVYSCGIRVLGQCYSIPFEHALQPTIDVADFTRVLGKWFTDPDIQRMNHNLPFDCHCLEEQLGIPMGPLWCCTMLQAWVVNPESDHGLKELAAMYGLAEGGKNYTAQFGKTAWSHLPTRLANYYLCKDVDLVPKLFGAQQQILAAKPKLDSLFWDLEMPMLNITYGIERRGMRIDEDYWLNVLTPKVYTEYAQAIEALTPIIEPYLHTLKKPMTVPEALESPAALARIYFDGRGLPLKKFATLKRDKHTGEWTRRSLDKDAIAEFKDEREDIRLLADFRKVNTVRKLIVNQVPKLWTRCDDGVRSHPVINEIGTKSGRQSIQRPNLQQTPSRMGALVRNAYIPSEGNVFLGYDFSQQEMRLMAHYSLDQGLYDIFTKSKLDMYSQMAVDVFGLDPNEFADEHKAKSHPVRHDTKITVLGTGYGMMAGKLGRSLGIPKREAQGVLDRYFGRYPGIKTYQGRTEIFARANGYIPTLLGRERPIDPNSYGWERAAMNQPIQGSAADQCKLAALACHRLILQEGWPVWIWLMIHDEIIFEANKEWVQNNQRCVLKIKETMESALPLIVPVVCHFSVESRWGETYDVDKHWYDEDDLYEAA